MGCLTAIISILELFLLLAQLGFEAMIPPSPSSGFVQTPNSPSYLFSGAGFNPMNAATVGRHGSEVWDVFSRQAADTGLGACRTRTLVFNEGSRPALQISCGVYTERLLQGIDLVISEAGKNGIHLILCLGPQYLRCPTNLDGDAFYTNRVVNSHIKKQIKRVLTRINTVTGVAYRDDPTIMGWELMGLQPPHGQVDPYLAGKTLNGWIQYMASFIKSIDGNHMLTVGVEEFYRDSNVLQRKAILNPLSDQVDTDFISNLLSIKQIDSITRQVYPDKRLKSGEADIKGRRNFKHFPHLDGLPRRFLLHKESPPPSLVVVSHVKGAVPPSQPSGCTNIPSNEPGHCPND